VRGSNFSLRARTVPAPCALILSTRKSTAAGQGRRRPAGCFRRGEHLKNALVEFQDRKVERAAAQIKTAIFARSLSLSKP